MTFTAVLLLFCWASVFLTAFKLSGDILSPVSLYCGSLLFFFGDIFISEYDFSIYFIYLAIMINIMLCNLYYLSSEKNNRYSVSNCRLNVDNEKSKIFDCLPNWLFWLLSLPALIAMVIWIENFGGIDSYMLASKDGARSFYGQGIIKTIVSTFYPVSLYYFSTLVTCKRNVYEYLLYIIHLSILVALALMSLSRGTLVTQFIFMMIIYHYQVKKLKFRFVATCFLLMLALASVYGVVRENFTIDSAGYSMGLELDNLSSIYKTEWLEFGLFPLKEILTSSVDNKEYGMTYLAAITNFIPRNIWPDKPNPGGVVFTQTYVPWLYDDYSHYTTGLIPESIINFGVTVGVPLGLIEILIILFLLTRVHRNIDIIRFAPMLQPKLQFELLVYVYTVWSCVLLLTGEFANIITGLIIKIIILTITYLLLNTITLKKKSRKIKWIS